MKMKIQNFTLSLFMLLSLLAVLLWSLSLYLLNDSLNDEKSHIYQNSWQIQLDQLQLTQGLWLQTRFKEVREWVEQSTDPLQRLHFINQYYHSHPQLRSIQINGIASAVTQGNSKVNDCGVVFSRKPVVAVNSEVPILTGCFLNSKPMIGLAVELPPLNLQKNPQLLVILMDYYSFLPGFERLTERNFRIDSSFLTTYHYKDVGADNETSLVTFEFTQSGLNFGSLSVGLPFSGFLKRWVEQARWLIPMLLIITFILYRILFRALIHPLLMITRRMEKIVLTRRPGNSFASQLLSPGLRLLHKYFMHLTYMSKHDPLTGLNNRVIFEERLQQAIVEGKRSGRKYALVLVDINHFHKVNKKFGNYMGDGLLKQLAKRLSNGIRESDSLARLEKDNFALLLEFSHEQMITSLIDKLYQSLSKIYSVYGREINAGISIGVAIYPDHAQEMEELELKGNEALLNAHQGDWPVVFFQPSGDQANYSGLSLIQSLRQALENKDFKLVYQPVMNLKNNTTSYFEALLRWKHPEKQTQSIEKTIELAEKNQLIKPLSHWIIETACQQLKKMSDCPVKIAVNLSMIDFHDESLPDRIGEMLQRYAVAPAKLLVEITEGQFMQEPDQVIGILTRLSDMGISLSIDDFGTGEASLTYLKKLPVEKLKIDQSFVKNMVEDEKDRAIVEATIKLAHTLGIEVVAEGVESAEIHALLVQMECDYVQGYYISRAIDEKMIPDWIEDRHQSIN